MERILERYERYSSSDKQLNPPKPSSYGSWTLEQAKLKAKLEALQKNQKHCMGEELDNLSLKELQNVEQQLESALKHIRIKKNHLMNDSISELQKRDKLLLEQNNVLAKKVKEKEKALAEEAQTDEQVCDLNSPTFLEVTTPTLNMGSGYEANGTAARGTEARNQIPSWLRLIKE